jgi:YCII-related domain
LKNTLNQRREIKMAKYLLAYRGGGMAQTDAERDAAMKAWGEWFGRLGAAIVDPGNPFGASSAVTADGTATPGDLTGYSLVNAEDLTAATELVEGCPILSSGGSVEVYETIPIEM